jgi:hypothetical protein
VKVAESDHHVVEKSDEALDTCDWATSNWDLSWVRCPVCGVMPDREGVWVHKSREELIQ